MTTMYELVLRIFIKTFNSASEIFPVQEGFPGNFPRLEILPDRGSNPENFPRPKGVSNLELTKSYYFIALIIIVGIVFVFYKCSSIFT